MVTNEQRKQACVWLKAHEVDPCDVPIWSLLVWDPDTSEWIIATYARDDAGRIRTEDGEAVIEMIHRKHRGIDPPSWFGFPHRRPGP